MSAPIILEMVTVWLVEWANEFKRIYNKSIVTIVISELIPSHISLGRILRKHCIYGLDSSPY